MGRRFKTGLKLSFKIWNFILPITIILIFIILGIINIFGQASIIRSDIINETQNDREEFQTFFSGKLISINNSIENIIDSSIFQNLINNSLLFNKSSPQFNTLRNLFIYVIKVHESIFQLRLLNSSGFEVFRLDKANSGQITESSYFQNKSSRDYFILAKETNPNYNHTIIFDSQVNLNIENGSIQIPSIETLRFYVPLFLKSQFLGLFIININFKILIQHSSLFNSNSINSDLRPFLVNNQGDYLVHYNSSKEITYTTDNSLKNYNLFIDYTLNNNSFNKDEIFYYNHIQNSFPDALSLYFSKSGNLTTLLKINIGSAPIHSFIFLGFEYFPVQHFNSFFNYIFLTIVVIIILGLLLFSLFHFMNNKLIYNPLNEMNKTLLILEKENIKTGDSNFFIKELNELEKHIFTLSDNLNLQRVQNEKNLIEINYQNQILEEKVEKRTNELNELLKRYKWVFNNAGDGIILYEIDPSVYEETIIDANKVVYEKYGYTKDEFLKLKLKDFSRTPNDQYIKKALAEVISTKSAYFSGTHYTRDGKELAVEIRTSVYTDNGKIFNISIVRDLTERTKNLLLIRKLSKIVEQALNSIFIIDNNGFVEFINESFLLISGFSKDEFLRQNFKISLTDKSKIIFENLLKNDLESNSTWTGELEHVKVDNSKYWTTTSITRLADDHGNVMNYFIIEDDITADKKMNEQLKEKTTLYLEEKLKIETILNNIPFGVIVIKNKLEIIYLNKNIKMILQNEFDLNLDLGVGIDNLESLDFLRDSFEFIKDNKTYTRVLKLKSNKQWEITFNLIKVESLDEIAIVIFKDISENVEFEIVQKQFVTTISHELRTPIYSILLSINNLNTFSSKLTTDQKNSLLNLINQNSVILKNMVEDLLILSKIDKRELTIRSWEKFQVRDEIENIINQFNSLLLEKQLIVKFLNNNSPFIYGDIERFQQVIRIIIENAIKYSYKENQILINLSDDYIGNYNSSNQKGILIIVQDFGMGIPESEQKFITKRFFRGTNVQNIEGTGIGLSILKEILLLLKGEFYFESTEGKGTKVILFLPFNIKK